MGQRGFRSPKDQHSNIADFVRLVVLGKTTRKCVIVRKHGDRHAAWLSSLTGLMDAGKQYHAAVPSRRTHLPPPMAQAPKPAVLSFNPLDPYVRMGKS